MNVRAKIVGIAKFDKVVEIVENDHTYDYDCTSIFQKKYKVLE